MKPQRAQVLFAITSVLLLLSSPAAGEVFFAFDDHLVAYWPFDDGADPTPNDRAPSGAAADDGAFVGDAGYSDGTSLPPVYGTAHALALDGDNDWMSVPDSPDLDRSGDLTLTAWVRPSTIKAEQNIISKDWAVLETNYNLSLRETYGVNTAGVGVTFNTAASYLGSTVGFGGCSGTSSACYAFGDGTEGLEPETWYHVAGVYDDTTKTMTVYVNGVEHANASFTTSGSPDVNNTTVQIGHRKGLSYSDYHGLIDEVRIYDVALSAEQVLALASDDHAPRYSCLGFEAPLASGPVTVRGSRALPFKAQLLDADGNRVTDLDVSAPPVIQVWYEYGTPDADDVTDEALPAGQSSEGNLFFFDSDQRWHYNLRTKNYSATGTYTVFMDSGDASEYVVDPTCTGQVVVN